MSSKDKTTQLKTTRLQSQLQALSDIRRLQLLAQLAAGPRQCSDLSTALGLDHGTIAYHLSELAAAGFVTRAADSEDGHVTYALVPEGLAAMSTQLAWLTRPPMISFVAKSGTGKTTFLEALIPELKARGVRVGVLKHHAHPTPFDVRGKDTYRLAQAGANVVVGASTVQVAVFRQEDGTADLDSVIARHLGEQDLVVTEGFKRGDYPKIEIHRAGYRGRLLCDPDELLALVTDEPLDNDVPQFDLEDAAGVADFLVAWLRSEQ